MVDVITAADNIAMIDDRLYSFSGRGSVYLLAEEQKALVDTGPATSADTVLAGIKQAGVRPEDIEHIIVTHVHLDHSGGAGVLLRHMPRAQVWVHHRGARHLVDPSRLVSAAVAVQGEKILAMSGETVPVAEGRVRPVFDGEELRLSAKQLLRFIDAPGHAPHELCIHESRNNGLFVGDAVGMYMNLVTNSEEYLATLRRILALKVSRLYFAHFGVVSQVSAVLEQAINKVLGWDKMTERALKENDFEGLERELTARVYQELGPLKSVNESLYSFATEMGINVGVAGYVKFQKDKKEAAQRRNSESNHGKN